MWRGVDKAIDLHEIKEGDGVDIGNGGDGLVAIAVETEVGIAVAGHVFAATAAGTVSPVAVVAC